MVSEYRSSVPTVLESDKSVLEMYKIYFGNFGVWEFSFEFRDATSEFRKCTETAEWDFGSFRVRKVSFGNVEHWLRQFGEQNISFQFRKATSQFRKGKSQFWNAEVRLLCNASTFPDSENRCIVTCPLKIREKYIGNFCIYQALFHCGDNKPTIPLLLSPFPFS